jgi:hypothetical protein
MNGAGRESLRTQSILDVVTGSLGFDEDQNETLFDCKEEAHQGIKFFVLLDILHSLSDIPGSRSDTSNRQKDIVLKEITGQALDVGRECGTKHHSLPIANTRHAFFFDNATNLRLKTLKV